MNIIQSTKDGIFTEFEHMELSVKVGKTQMRLYIIYRPPLSGQNRFKATMFLEDWSNYLDRLTTIPQEVIITGDLNFHFDDPTDINVRRFTGQLDAYGATCYWNNSYPWPHTRCDHYKRKQLHHQGKSVYCRPMSI